MAGAREEIRGAIACPYDGSGLEMIFLLHRLMQYADHFQIFVAVPVENYVSSTGKAVQTGANTIPVSA